MGYNEDTMRVQWGNSDGKEGVLCTQLFSPSRGRENAWIEGGDGGAEGRKFH